MKRCDNLQTNPRKPVHLVACMYKASGNYRNGKPYAEGPSCTWCLSEHRCNRNQCSRF
uniref:SCP domain-containing protein n=1 Tax=Mesocestoides corti TaxID=53468 RepID=A0A5K3G2J6_MESCO